MGGRRRLGGRSRGPEAGFSRPQALGRPPGLISSTAAITTAGWTSRGCAVGRCHPRPCLDLARVGARVAHCACEWTAGVVVTCTVPIPRAGEIKMGWSAGEWVGAPEDRRPAFHGRRLRGGHPALWKDGRHHCPRMELARVERVAHCAREWAAGWWSRALCRSRARGKSKWGGRPGNGWARRRTGGRLFTAAGSGAATRPCGKTAAITARGWSSRGWDGRRLRRGHPAADTAAAIPHREMTGEKAPSRSTRRYLSQLLSSCHCSHKYR